MRPKDETPSKNLIHYIVKDISIYKFFGCWVALLKKCQYSIYHRKHSHKTKIRQYRLDDEVLKSTSGLPPYLIKLYSRIISGIKDYELNGIESFVNSRTSSGAKSIKRFLASCHSILLINFRLNNPVSFSFSFQLCSPS